MREAAKRLQRAAAKLATLLVSIFLADFQPSFAQSEPDVGEFVRTRCSVCHSFEWVTSRTKTREGWAETLERVRSYGVEDIWGTQISPEFRGKILDYLTNNFGPLKTATAAYDLLVDPQTGKIRDPFVEKYCKQCHGLELIAANRKTPEGWNFTVQQMRWYSHRLNQQRGDRPYLPGEQTHVVENIPPEDAEYLARYLAQTFPLLPGELAGNQTKPFDADGERVCMSCHGMGTIRQQVKAPEAWEKTVGRMEANHGQEVPGFRRGGFPSGWSGIWTFGVGYGDIPAGQSWSQIREKVIGSLKENFRYDTDEWKSWMAEGSRKDNLLEGVWDVFGKDNMGQFQGTIRFTHMSQTHNEYTVSRSVTYRGSGGSANWYGTAVLYGGGFLRTRYQWSSGPGIVQFLGWAFEGEELEERSLRKISGQFALSEDRMQFTGSYKTEGAPVPAGEETYVRRDNQMRVLWCEPSAVERGVPGVELFPELGPGIDSVDVVIHGRWLPVHSFWSFFDWFRSLVGGPATQVSFSDAALRVVDLERSRDGGNTMRVRIRVPPEAKIGWNDVTVRDNWGNREATGKKLLLVYDDIHQVRVDPPLTTARLGSAPIQPRVTDTPESPRNLAQVIPAVPAQLRAFSYSNGPDGKPNTADDVRIEEVPVQWSSQAVDLTATRWRLSQPREWGGPYSSETKIEPGAPPSGDADRDRHMAQGKTVEIPGVGRFHYVPNSEKQPFGTLSASGIFTPSSESPQVDLDEGRSPMSRTARTNTGDFRGTALVKATYQPPEGGEPVVGYGVVVVSPPDWTPWIPWEDESSRYYYTVTRPPAPRPDTNSSRSSRPPVPPLPADPAGSWEGPDGE